MLNLICSITTYSFLGGLSGHCLLRVAKGNKKLGIKLKCIIIQGFPYCSAKNNSMQNNLKSSRYLRICQIALLTIIIYPII